MMAEQHIRIVLTDDHPIVLDGLQRLFQTQPDFEVVSCCRDGDSALEVLRSSEVDVLLLDQRMPGKTVLDVLRTLSY